MVAGYSGGARTDTLKFNGSTWSDSGHTFPVGTYNLGITGTSSACIETAYNGATAKTYKYNNTSWSEAGDLSTNSDSAPVAGTVSAAMVTGFDYATTAPNNYKKTSVYNGTSWSAGTDLPARRGGAGSFGTTSSLLTFAGSSDIADTGKLATSVLWNGTSWAADGTCSTACWTIEGNGNCGSVTSGLKMGGQITSNNATLVAEIYTGEGAAVMAYVPRVIFI
jgi:hypothetical protein